MALLKLLLANMLMQDCDMLRGKLVPRSGATMTAAGDILYIFGGQVMPCANYAKADAVITS